MDVLIRRLTDRDSLDELTDLLHRSYARLAEMGLRFMATHQTVNVTQERVSYGECYVAEVDSRVVGTICFYGPSKGSGCDWYDRDDVAKFGQFAVDPAFQNAGIGKMLLAKVEERAREIGASELALDTSEGAGHLIELYRRWGYRIVDSAQWEEVNYRSVIMSKKVD